MLAVDSLNPRGVSYICDGRPESISPWHRALDAYGAKQYLSKQPYIDASRIGVIGMSHGGMTVLEVVKQSTVADQALQPFQGAIALYPLCGQPEPLNAPTLIPIGDRDTWTPASQCDQYQSGMTPPQDLTLRVFSDAYHLFDYPDIDTKELGHTLRSNPDAAAEAFTLVRQFLQDQL